MKKNWRERQMKERKKLKDISYARWGRKKELKLKYNNGIISKWSE